MTPTPKAEHETIRIGFFPGEFSVPTEQQRRFVRRIFGYAKAHGLDLMGGTEASASPRNETRAFLIDFGPDFGYRVATNRHGEWLAVRKDFGRLTRVTFDPVIPAEGGSARQGAHDLRGIQAVAVAPHEERIGLVHAGVSHWLTKGQEPDTVRGHWNVVLEDEIGAWGREQAHGSDLAYYMGDTNRDLGVARNQDGHGNDVFHGHPFNTCWDDLGTYPVTHPHDKAGVRGPTLDMVAGWEGDGRSVCVAADALDDDELPLPVDHFGVRADYRVRLMSA